MKSICFFLFLLSMLCKLDFSNAEPVSIKEKTTSISNRLYQQRKEYFRGANKILVTNLNINKQTGQLNSAVNVIYFNIESKN